MGKSKQHFPKPSVRGNPRTEGTPYTMNLPIHNKAIYLKSHFSYAINNSQALPLSELFF